MSEDTLFVVPTERHVERLAREGKRAETRASFSSRLAAALAPDVRFAEAREARLALAFALEEPAARTQLDLFGGTPDDPLLGALRERGGASWIRLVDALDEAIGALRRRGATAAHLERVRSAGVASARSKTIATAMSELDRVLARAGAVDRRAFGVTLAPAIRSANADALLSLVGARHLRARWIVSWEPDDLTWWRALDEALSRSRGDARVIVPSFDKRLEGARERDPLEIIADSVARQLDAAPETETIAAVLGDLAATPPRLEDATPRVRLLRVGDTRSQASEVARLVRRVLDEGARLEKIAIAYPSRDERTLVPLRRALSSEGIVFHDSFGAPPSSVPVVAAALHALEAAESLERLSVARLLRSGYIDALRVLGGQEGGTSTFREADRQLARLARALESRATVAGESASERLVLTAAGRDRADEALARRFVEPLARARGATTRGQHVQNARALFQDLGFASRAGRGALATFARDEAPTGVDRAERLAVARDVRAWELVLAALESYETTGARANALERPLDADTFRLELTELLDSSARLPGAGRAGAVRIGSLTDLPGQLLDLLVVLDVNDGVLPRDVPRVTLANEALQGAIAKVARDAYSPARPSELAARDLAALAMASSEATRTVLVTTAEDAGDAPAAPSRVFEVLERTGVVVATTADGVLGGESTAGRPSGVASTSPLATPAEILRRARREHSREAFFLDPARPESDAIGNLSLGGADRRLIASVVATETGADAERALAVTSIERFAQCPFKGYAHAVLSAREAEEQSELPDAREEGNLGHTALAAAFLATRDEWPRRPRDERAILTAGLAAADAALAESEGHAPLRAIVRLRVRESVRAVLLRALADLEWNFALAEQAFGKGKPWPPYHVTDDRVDVWLRGSVDRVDRAANGKAARVIDYKRSKNTVREATPLLGETAIQVPIYAAVTGRRLEVDATGIYLPTQPRDLATETKPNTRAEDRVRDLVRRQGGAPSEIERRVLVLAEGARSGRFTPLPAREAECTHCGVSGGCRKPRFAMAPEVDPGDAET